MEHTARKKNGQSHKKILPECTLPLTGVGVVNRIITDLGVLEVAKSGLKLLELAPGVTKEELAEKTGHHRDVGRRRIPGARPGDRAAVAVDR